MDHLADGYNALMQALHRTVHSFGVEKLNSALGHKNPNTLSNKVNPGLPSHQPRLDEYVYLVWATGDYSSFYELSRLFRHSSIPLGSFEHLSDVELLTAYTHYHAEIGQTAQALHKALERGGYVPPELYQELEREFFEDLAAGREVLARVRALMPEPQPEAAVGG